MKQMLFNRALPSFGSFFANSSFLFSEFFFTFGPHFWPHRIWSGCCLSLCQFLHGPHISLWRFFFQKRKPRESCPWIWQNLVLISVPLIDNAIFFCITSRFVWVVELDVQGGDDQMKSPYVDEKSFRFERHLLVVGWGSSLVWVFLILFWFFEGKFLMRAGSSNLRCLQWKNLFPKIPSRAMHTQETFLVSLSSHIDEFWNDHMLMWDETQPLFKMELWVLKMVLRIVFQREFSHLPEGLGQFKDSNSIP